MSNGNSPLFDQTMFEKVNFQGEDIAQNNDLSKVALDQFVLIKFWLHLVLAFRLILKQSKNRIIFIIAFTLYTTRENLINIKPVHRGQLIFSGVFSN